MTSTFIYEDGQGRMLDGQGAELMEIDHMVPRIKNLTTMTEYIEHQVGASSFSDVDVDINCDQQVPSEFEGSKGKVSKKSWTKYELVSKYNFIMHMLLKCPKSTAAVARKYSIHPRTGQRWWRQYKDDPDNFFRPKPRGNRKKLGSEHAEFLRNLYDENAQTTIDVAVERLTGAFEGLSIHKTAVNDFLKDDMRFSIKKAVFHSSKRNSEENLEQRYNWAKEIVEMTDMDYLKNCVFIDESGFHINLRNSMAWAPVGETPVVKVRNTRATSHTILGAISAYGVLNISLKLPDLKTTEIVPVDSGKKRKLPNGGLVKEKASKGTTTDHYAKFVKDTLDEMDKFDYMEGFYLVMDNCSIHKRKDIKEMIERRNHKCVFLPPYSPELNPIEVFWAVVKGKIRRQDLLDDETLQTRIAEACNAVPQNHLYNFVRHSKDRIEDCLQRNHM